MSKDKSENWFGRHKVLTVIGSLVVLIIIASAASSGSKTNTQTVNSNDTKTAAPAPSAKPATQDTLTIKNSAFQSSNGMQQVVGEITDNDSIKHSAMLKATFYDAGGKILGTASGAVNDIAPGDTKTFNLITIDTVTGYKDMKVQVDTLL